MQDLPMMQGEGPLFFQRTCTLYRDISFLIKEDNGCVYFYVFYENPEPDGWPEYSGWIMNTEPAPSTLSTADIRAGKQIRMPSNCCTHPSGQPAPRKEKLRISASENFVVLTDDNLVIAVIENYATVNPTAFSRYSKLSPPYADLHAEPLETLDYEIVEILQSKNFVV
jgi:hypothetical protein